MAGLVGGWRVKVTDIQEQIAGLYFLQTIIIFLYTFLMKKLK